jgi:hypothetical protein
MALVAGICRSEDGGSRFLSSFSTYRSMSSYSRILAWKTRKPCVKFFSKISNYLESVITWASTRRRLIRAMEESRACCWRLATLPPSWSWGGDGCGQSVLLSPSDKAKEVEICSFSETSAWIAATHNTFPLWTMGHSNSAAVNLCLHSVDNDSFTFCLLSRGTWRSVTTQKNGNFNYDGHESLKTRTVLLCFALKHVFNCV